MIRTVCAAILVSAAVSVAQEPSPGRTVWDGVFAAAQADRGNAAYTNHCSRCHGEDLATSRNPLAGDRFAEHWESRTLADLFRRIRDTMPPGEAVTVAASEKLEAMVYVLQQNGFPEGSQPLADDEEALRSIRITRKTGPGPLRTGTLVRVAGCLARRNEREWQLVQATAPQRTALDSLGGTVAAPAETGNGTIALLNPYPDPGSHAGHRVAVTGLLIRSHSGDSINVVSLEVIASSCPE
jgi:mono/diheme cytochrome c family protein